MKSRARHAVLRRLKRLLRRHYLASQANRDLSCGGTLGDHIRGNDTLYHYNETRRLARRLARIDRTFPNRESWLRGAPQ